MTDWPTLVIALVGLAISVTLAAVKVWETFLARARFDLMYDWFDASDVELMLTFTVANVGHRADSIRGISFLSEVGEAHRSAAVTSALPVHLRPGEVSPRFEIAVRTDVAWDPGTSLFVGKGRIRISDSRRTEHDFSVPNPYDVGILSFVEEPPPIEDNG